MPGDIAHTPPPADSHSTGWVALGSTKRSSTSSVHKTSDLSFASQIPHDGISSAARSGENVLYMIVPGNRCNFVEFWATVSGRVGLGRIFEIPYVNLEGHDSALQMYAVGASSNLAIDSTGRKQMRLYRVEVETADRACVSLVSEYQRFGGSSFLLDLVHLLWSRFLGSLCVRHNLGRIPNVQIPVFHTGYQDSLRSCCVR